ncbi:MAG: hypothetical protein ABR562_09045 [Thermoplasmatota archaeon]
MQKAVATGPKEAILATRAFLQYWSEALGSHFEEEMRYVVPATPEGSLQGRYNMIEEALRNAVDQLRITMMDPQFFRASILQVLPLLRNHVNFCEATLFEDVQDNVEEPAMAQLGRQMFAFRRERRPGALGLQRSEPSYVANAPPPPA